MLSAPTVRIVGAALLALACSDGPTSPPREPPASISIASGDAQRGTAGAALASPLVVTVGDAEGRPVAGAEVRFSVIAGGGEVLQDARRTDEAGRASAAWTLGTIASQPQRVEATVVGTAGNGAPQLAVTFTATATPAAPAQLLRLDGDGQTGTLGLILPESLVVRVADRYGNGVPHVAVTWAVSDSTGDHIAARDEFTDTAGIVSAAWTLGARLDVARVATATAAGVPAITFWAVAQLAPDARLEKLGGDAQRAPVGSALPDSLSIRLTLADGTPVRGAAVAWAASTGGGSIVPDMGTTDPNGVSRASWVLGTTLVPNEATATVSGLPAAVFEALPVTEAPASIVKVLGDEQHGVPGQLALDSLVVFVTDRYGNPVPDATVAFAATTGDGLVAPPAVATDAQGHAATSVRLGVTGTENIVTATVADVAPVSFHIIGTPGSDWTLTGQDGAWTVAAATTISGLEARLTDGSGRPVPGALVRWTASDGGIPQSATILTDDDGRVTNAWTVGCPAHVQTMVAEVQGVVPLQYTANVGPPMEPWQFTARAHFDGAPAYSRNGVSITVEGAGCPVSDVPIVPQLLPGSLGTPTGMVIFQQASVTDEDGRATFNLVMGELLEPQCVRFYASVIGSASSVEKCIATFAIVASLRIDPPDPVIDLPGASVTLSAIAFDENGQPLRGAAWQVLDPAIAEGVVEGDYLFRVTGRAVGTARITATLGVVAETTTVRVNAIIPPMAIGAGPLSDQVGEIGVPIPLTATVTDLAGLPVANVPVSWAVAAGTGSLDGAMSVTDALGRARITLTPGTVAGDNIVTATAAEAGSARFLVWTPSAPAARLTILDGTGQSGYVGHVLPRAITVRVEDQYGNGSYQESVTFAVTSGEGHVERTTLTTDTLGIAATTWTTGSLGTNTASATWNGQSVTFVATAISGGGPGIVIAGPAERTYGGPTVGGFWVTIDPPLTVKAIDDAGAAIPDATVSWSDGATTATDAYGLASHAPQVIIGMGGTQTVTATVAGGATAVFTVITIPSIAAPLCSGGYLGPLPPTGRVGTRLPDPFLFTCRSRQGAPLPATFYTTGPMGKGEGGTLLAVPGYRAPGEYQWYWVLPAVPGTYDLWVHTDGAVDWFTEAVAVP